MSAVAISSLIPLIGTDKAPLIVDVRRDPRYDEDDRVIPGSIRRSPGQHDLPATGKPVIVYCVHGHEVGQEFAAATGADYLIDGIEGWKEAGGPTRRKHPLVDGRTPTRWVTRERPKIDRLACPWLIRRFIDPLAEFVYVPPPAVKETADAIPYDVPGVTFTHRADRCSFDAFVEDFGLSTPAMDRLALIIRGADTERHDLTPQSPGLFAISLGMGRIIEDDHALLEKAMTVYDALYAWCRDLVGETHAWPPKMEA